MWITGLPQFPSRSWSEATRWGGALTRVEALLCSQSLPSRPVLLIFYKWRNWGPETSGSPGLFGHTDLGIQSEDLQPAGARSSIPALPSLPFRGTYPTGPPPPSPGFNLTWASWEVKAPRGRGLWPAPPWMQQSLESLSWLQIQRPGQGSGRLPPTEGRGRRAQFWSLQPGRLQGLSSSFSCLQSTLSQPLWPPPTLGTQKLSPFLPLNKSPATSSPNQTTTSPARLESKDFLLSDLPPSLHNNSPPLPTSRYR